MLSRDSSQPADFLCKAKSSCLWSQQYNAASGRNELRSSRLLPVIVAVSKRQSTPVEAVGQCPIHWHYYPKVR